MRLPEEPPWQNWARPKRTSPSSAASFRTFICITSSGNDKLGSTSIDYTRSVGCLISHDGTCWAMFHHYGLTIQKVIWQGLTMSDVWRRTTLCIPRRPALSHRPLPRDVPQNWWWVATWMEENSLSAMSYVKSLQFANVFDLPEVSVHWQVRSEQDHIAKRGQHALWLIMILKI